MKHTVHEKRTIVYVGCKHVSLVICTSAPFVIPTRHVGVAEGSYAMQEIMDQMVFDTKV